MENNKDFYAVLGVSKGSSQDEIRKAYRRLAMKYHPDRNPGNKSAEEKFKELANAYEVLGDPVKRKAYEEGGRQKLDETGYKEYTSTKDIYSDFGDIFSELFGESYHSRKASSPAKGSDLEYAITVGFMEAALGAEKEVALEKESACDSCGGTGAKGGARSTCPTCGGRGVVSSQQRQKGQHFTVSTVCPSCKGTRVAAGSACTACGGKGSLPKVRKLRLKIPPGVNEGAAIRIRGEGEPGHNGGPAGDLFIKLSIEEHPDFEREGNDIRISADLPFNVAILGGELSVPTVRGQAVLKIPKRTQSGQTLRMKEMGIHGKSGEKGDQLVRLRVTVPKDVTPEQEELLKKW